MELCRECAEKVAATAAAQTRDSHGRTPANIRHWMESSGDVRGPVQVFECVWKGEGIIKHRKRVELSSRHVGVLRERFERHGPGGASEADFHLRLFNMLLRYETLFFLDQGTQGALPPRVFQLLQTHFGIEHECFASQATTTLSPWACWHLSSRRRAFSDRWWLRTGRSTRPRHLRHSIRSSSTSTV